MAKTSRSQPSGGSRRTSGSPRAKGTTRKAAGRERRTREAATGSSARESGRQQYARALGLYEQALDTLQRRKLADAATLFQRVIDEFPDERELHERSRRYLQVCERQSVPAPTPRTLEERVYAATIALNAGRDHEALTHLEAALKEDPESDQVQYMLAVAQAVAGQTTTAVDHLHRAIELNPDNRYLARHEPGFDALREHEGFRRAVRAARDAD